MGSASVSDRTTSAATGATGAASSLTISAAGEAATATASTAPAGAACCSRSTDGAAIASTFSSASAGAALAGRFSSRRSRSRLPPRRLRLARGSPPASPAVIAALFSAAAAACCGAERSALAASSFLRSPRPSPRSSLPLPRRPCLRRHRDVAGRRGRLDPGPDVVLVLHAARAVHVAGAPGGARVRAADPAAWVSPRAVLPLPWRRPVSAAIP